jgi:hypothetical protein
MFITKIRLNNLANSFVIDVKKELTIAKIFIILVENVLFSNVSLATRKITKKIVKCRCDLI